MKIQKDENNVIKYRLIEKENESSSKKQKAR